MKTKLLILFMFLGFSDVFAQTDKINHRNWDRKNGNTNIALVIGNSEYEHGGRLLEPANDASVIIDALKSQGFDVMSGLNLDNDELFNIVDDFADHLKKYGVAIVFYAGHGFQVDGENYLIPINANLSKKAHVKRYCMNVNYILEEINNPEIAKLILMDACRNNPFERSWVVNERETLHGMVSIKALENSMIMFSTAEGTTVSDENRFAEILSEKIKEGGCLQGSIISQVKKEIKRENPEQLIRPSGWLDDDICFGAKTPIKLPREIQSPISRNNKNMVLVKVVKRDSSATYFHIGKFEVTNIEYADFLNDIGNQVEGGQEWYNIESRFAQIERVGGFYRVKHGKVGYPVTEVTWYGAKAYCKWLSEKTGQPYRLPTDKELRCISLKKDRKRNYNGPLKSIGAQQPNHLSLCGVNGSVYEWCDQLDRHYFDVNKNKRKRKGLSGRAGYDFFWGKRRKKSTDGNRNFGFRVAY